MIVAIDVETTGLNPWTDRLLGLSIAEYDAQGKIQTAYYPWGGQDEVFPFPWDLLSDPTISKVGHNLRFDLKFLHLNGVTVQGPWEDTKLLAQLIEENRPLGLKPLATEYLGKEATRQDRRLLEHLKSLKLTKADLSDSRVDQKIVADYCEEDTRNTLLLYEILSKKIKENLKKYYYEEMLPLEKVLFSMEIAGNKIDLEALDRAEVALNERILDYQTKLNSEVAEELVKICHLLQEEEMKKHPLKAKQGRCLLPEFNWQSNRQKTILFYNLLGLGSYCHAVTASGAPSLERKVLNNLNLPEGKLKRTIQLQVELQSYSKMRSAYIDGIRSRLQGGYIHGEYNQAPSEEWNSEDAEGGTVTGRLAHRNPNLGNLPRKQKAGGDYYRGTFVKDLFIPSSPDHCFLYADYKQIELRLAAHLSNDPEFLEAFNLEKDPHAQTAEALGIERHEGKTVNFLLIYFGSAWRLAIELGWDPKDETRLRQAERIRNEFFSAHSHLYNWIMDQRRYLKQWGEIPSMFGRVRRLKKVWSSDRKEVEHALKQAGNFVVQSVAASICKRAMIKLHSEGFRIRNQVHDSITCEVTREEAPEKMEEMKNIMMNVVKLQLPFDVDIKIIDTFKE